MKLNWYNQWFATTYQPQRRKYLISEAIITASVAARVRSYLAFPAESPRSQVPALALTIGWWFCDQSLGKRTYVLLLMMRFCGSSGERKEVSSSEF